MTAYAKHHFLILNKKKIKKIFSPSLICHKRIFPLKPLTFYFRSSLWKNEGEILNYAYILTSLCKQTSPPFSFTQLLTKKGTSRNSKLKTRASSFFVCNSFLVDIRCSMKLVNIKRTRHVFKSENIFFVNFQPSLHFDHFDDFDEFYK